jgi:putative hemolysin
VKIMPGVIAVDLLKILAVFALVFANAFFVAAEFSLVSVRRTRVDELIAQGNATAGVVRRAIDDPDRFIAATQLGITLASLALGWAGEPAVAHLIEPYLARLPTGAVDVTAAAIASAIAFALITFLTVVLGELAPKSVALQYPEETAFVVARPTVFFENVFRPAIWLLNGSGNLILRTVGLQTPSGHQRVHSVEELKMLVADSEKGGVLEAGEKEMIHRAFEFAERQVYETMIPRTDVVGVEAQATVGDLLSLFSQASHARFPVYEESLDNVVGVVAIKDVLKAIADHGLDAARPVRDLARPAYFVPETKQVGQLFNEMREQHLQMAIIIDEYGGTAGIVTIEELVEEIVGRLSDELALTPPSVETIDERTVQVDAQLRVDEVNEELGLDLPEDEDYETVAGFILYRLRRIPSEGDKLRYGNLLLTVTAMKGPKIEKVLIKKV